MGEAAGMADEKDEKAAEVRWVKARETLLGAAPKGRAMDDDEEVEADAALVFTAGDEQIVIEGSHRRLLKALDYARSALLATAPVLEVVSDDVAVVLPDGSEDDLGEIKGLRCPHCGATTWAGQTHLGQSGITVVDYGERYTDFAVRQVEGQLEVVGEFAESIAGVRDHYECTRCERPVTLPEGVRVVSR